MSLLSSRKLLALGSALCVLGLTQAGVAMADYSAGYYAHGILYCGLPSAGAYPIGATAPTMVPDVPNQQIAFRDELWNNDGGTWHMVRQSPWEYKRAPSDIFSATTATAFATYSWWTENGSPTSGYHSWQVYPGTVQWAIRQTLYWYAQSYTVYGSQDFNADIFTRATRTGTLVAQAHSRVLWTYQSAFGGDGSDTCSLHNGVFR
jgi:hypothetical protein